MADLADPTSRPTPGQTPPPDVEPTPTITYEGVVADLTAEQHLADPVPGGSLSATAARLLLPPFCPALFRWWTDHPRDKAESVEMILGKAAHAVVLGTGPEIVPVDAADWRTKAAQQARDDARAAGQLPLLIRDVEVVVGMVDALRAHPIASRLLDPDHGQPEQSLFWLDDQTGVMRRGRLDWLPELVPGRRLIVPDYKTTRSASPSAFGRTATEYGYHLQAAAYLEAVRRLLNDEAAFVFVVQETRPPFLVSVVELDPEALRIGALLQRIAVDLYADCTRNDRWPGYADDVEMVDLPGWYARQYEEI